MDYRLFCSKRCSSGLNRIAAASRSLVFAVSKDCCNNSINNINSIVPNICHSTAAAAAAISYRFA
ncbi:MAG: hypothetical protein LCI00_22420 [Chloroflexi bacterium]|nr:hypothetical protein [Chloroflexota bacterium]MCC6895223.1 hypothetical protein [Anaerolineae bacterium]